MKPISIYFDEQIYSKVDAKLLRIMSGEFYQQVRKQIWHLGTKHIIMNQLDSIDETN